MAKYTTGNSGATDEGDACELCGTQSGQLKRATVAGASLLVCPDCAPHDDRQQGTSDGGAGNASASRKQSTHQSGADAAAETTPLWDGDSKHWEQQGTDYDDDPLPYLVSEYGSRARSARQDAGLQLDELADELNLTEDTLLAVEQDRAARAGVGGSVITAIEDYLDVTLSEDTQ